jgi:hypothetical protein
VLELSTQTDEIRSSWARLEGALLRAEERLKGRLDSAKDPGVTFEATGIDYLCVDEAHGYKNLRTPSNIADAAIDGSMRASDLDMKLDYLRRRNGARVATFATATPIANSVTEAYVMQRYLRPDLLEDAGITVFDTWAATFGLVVTQVELAPEGGDSFRVKSRFARFRNVPEMLRMWHVFADVKTAAQLNLPVPVLAPRPADGQRTGDDRRRALRRADRLRRRARPARRADPQPRRPRGGRRPDRGDLAGAPRRRVPGAGRHPVPGPGSLQLVFCDLDTPGEGWNVYDELRDRLAGNGLPREAIRFVHEAKSDSDLARLFAACRSGHVAVLVGSTEKMGTGTNVQDRAVALHHLDAPWRPADVAQRDGRIIRQGNLNDQVQVIRWVTARSFDGYMWQTLERKARFIHEVMSPSLDAREIADVGDTVLSFSEAKALATSNPLLMDKAEADAALARLQRAARAHARNQDALRHTITRQEERIAALGRAGSEIDAAIARRQDTRGDKFAMVIEDRRHVKRADAGQHLTAVLGREFGALGARYEAALEPGELAGFPLAARVERTPNGKVATLELRGAPRTSVVIPASELADADPAALVTRLENRLRRLEERKATTITDADHARREIEHATAGLGKAFPQGAELAAARERTRQIDAELERIAEAARRPAAGPPDAQPLERGPVRDEPVADMEREAGA